MRVTLVGNHVADVRMSMRRFLSLLESELRRAGVDVQTVAPTRLAWAEGLRPRARELLEKVAFEVGSLRGRSADIVHVVDQGDAGHVLAERGCPTVVTCHDISALADPRFLGAAGSRGRLHRRLLLGRMRAGLTRATALVCDSEDTLGDVDRAFGRNDRQLRARIYLPLRFADGAALPQLPSEVAALGRPYLLHVGSNGFRKNRHAVLEVARRSRHEPAIVFAGEAADAALLARGAELGLASRIVSVTRPDDALLARLYQAAHCLLFPSTFEGFGWPIVEAQSVGCPVVASNVTSLPEVARDGALLAGPHDHATLAELVDRLFEPGARAALVAAGRANAALFKAIDLGREYLAIYERLLAVRPRSQ
jgi:glycosyltransferase involved in cell wall biosynthesis